MNIWQADFYRRPLQDETGKPLWELVVCNADRTFTASAFCSQREANSTWLTQQIEKMAPDPADRPTILQVFRPQSVSLLQAASQPLGITVQPTRRTPTLKQVLQSRVNDYRTMPNYTGQPYEPIALDRPPPVPLPENLWGDQWRFASLPAQDLLPAFQNRPIPIIDLPEPLFPVNLQLPSTLPIPGVVIDGGRSSMPLARWMQRSNPVSLNYIPGEPDGLILEAGLVERWVLTTFDDLDVIRAARIFRERQQAAKGLHFVLIQPDDSGMTYTGVWLLQLEQ
ncbi:Tab2/Atab2 family RNA-binding protein [Egbenema bharatensis]|uniref:Tab2/Atab2 family RNA-binding protein n=1 Tax=Egbenema bharatensis TaxID=3463334 RepID=UPI003A8A6687